MDRICDNCMNRVPADAEKCPKCGIRFENTNPGGALPNGWVLGGRYTIGRYNDIDGEGVTYSAIDGDTLQRVTIKEFMPVTLCATRNDEGEILPKPGCEVLFKTTRMDYLELYAILQRLGLSEGLVQVLDVLEENNTAYAVLEKIEGPTLAEYLTKSELPIDSTRALAMLRPVLMGIETLHSVNLIHRGISPENIVLESGGTAKLGGFATLALRQQGSELKPKLYPGYSAPEQYSASEFEGRYTDVYAMGAVLYRMITGLAPNSADERKVQDAMRNARTVNKAIPTFVSSAIARSMRVAPAERIQTMPDLRLALSGEAALDERGPLGLTRQQLIVGAVAASAILILAAAIILISIFGGRKTAVPESSSEVESSSVVEEEIHVPDFVGKVYADIIKNTDYTDQFVFAQPEEREDEKIEAGIILEQVPEPGTVWDGKTPIKFVVSKGPAMVEMPDFVSSLTMREAAKAKLRELGFQDSQIEIYGRTNSGTLVTDAVLETNPKAGAMVNKATGKIVLYVANDVATARMPNLATLSYDAALAQLRELNIRYADQPVWTPNDGRFLPRTVISTSIQPNTEVNLANDVVTLTVANDVSMPNLIGMTREQANAELTRIAGTVSGVRVSPYFVDEVTDQHPAGKIFKTNKDGGTIQNGEQVQIYIAQAPPVSSDPAPATP